MEKYQEMCLVEGEVTFSIRVATLIPLHKSEDEKYVKELLEGIAEKEFDSTDSEVDFDNDVPVLVTPETIKKYQHQFVGDDNWREIITESRKIKKELRKD